jgi:hypothetical protein
MEYSDATHWVWYQQGKKFKKIKTDNFRNRRVQILKFFVSVDMLPYEYLKGPYTKWLKNFWKRVNILLYKMKTHLW